MGGPGPAPRGHARRLEVGPPIRDRAEISLDELTEDAVGIAAVAAQVLEVDLVVLDPADGERELDLERAHLGVDLVGGREVDAVELLQDLVPFRDVALVELVVGLDGLTRDAVELEELGLELPCRDLLELVEQRRQSGLPSWKAGGAYSPEPPGSCPRSGPVE